LFPSEGFDRLICRGSKSKDVELTGEQDCITGIKTLLCSKSANTLCYGTKCRNIM